VTGCSSIAKRLCSQASSPCSPVGHRRRHHRPGLEPLRRVGVRDDLGAGTRARGGGRRRGGRAGARVEIRAAIAGGVRAMDGAIQLLEAVRGPGLSRSRPTDLARQWGLDEGGLDPGGVRPVVTLKPLRPKPAPDLYLRACELLSVAPWRAIAVEDSGPGRRLHVPPGSWSSGSGRRPLCTRSPTRSCPVCATRVCLDLLGSSRSRCSRRRWRDLRRLGPAVGPRAAGAHRATQAS